MTIKAGTKVEVGQGFGQTETGVVMRWTKAMGDREALPRFHPIRFDSDGARLMVHEAGLRVIDNRPNRVG